jgi:glutaredoxin
MKKQIIIASVLILIVFGLISIFGSNQKKTTTVDTSTPVVVDADIFYWGETCPHCHDTIDWMDQNKIEEQTKVIRKEIYKNKDNAKELVQNAKTCGINENEIGVPFMFTKTKKCLVGTPEITSYLTEEINKLIKK